MQNNLKVLDTIEQNISQWSEFSSYLNEVSDNIPNTTINVLPNFVNDFLVFLQNSKRQKYQQKQFEIKAELLDSYIDKKFNTAISTIKSREHIELANIKSNENIELAKIAKDFQLQASKLENDYKLELQKINLQYMQMKSIIDDNNKKVTASINADIETRKEYLKMSEEIGQVCKFLFSKMQSGTATDEDKEYYVLLMDIRHKYFGEYNFSKSIQY